ncbi:MAG: putative Cupredoxin, partial [Frankiales bacterium]|nr:putative Cupredoxin [Frankiales bacterium]
GTFALSISGRAFHPQVFSIPRGTTVRATNNDAYAHNWTSNSGVWASGSLGFHQSYSYRFMNTGQFNFSCTIHPDMTGSVHVT